MTLREKQSKFVTMVGKLIQFANDRGYELSFGHAKRCDDCKVGHKKSLHKVGLAIDLNLFRNGIYLSKNEDHRELGEYWESLGGSWGGRFSDGNHYSLEHNGMK